MRFVPKLLRRIIIDAAGYGLIILSLLTGWLPGPGGIPLFLAGLGLLSIHNAWARRFLQYLKENGAKFLDIVFPENPWIKALHDIIVVGLICAVIILLSNTVNPVSIGIAVALTILAIVDILYNRKRWQRFTKKR